MVITELGNKYLHSSRYLIKGEQENVSSSGLGEPDNKDLAQEERGGESDAREHTEEGERRGEVKEERRIGKEGGGSRGRGGREAKEGVEG